MKNKLIDILLLSSLLITGILLCSLLITGCKNKDNDSFNSNNTIKSIDSNGIIKTETIENSVNTNYILGKTYISENRKLNIDTTGNVIFSINNGTRITTYKGFIDDPYIIFTEIDNNYKNYGPESVLITFIGKQSIIISGSPFGATYIIDNTENKTEVETTIAPTEIETKNEVESNETNIDNFIAYLNELPNKMPSVGDLYDFNNISSEINKYGYNISINGYNQAMNGTIESINNPFVYITGQYYFNNFNDAINYFNKLCNYIKSKPEITIKDENLTNGTSYYIYGNSGISNNITHDISISLYKNSNSYYLYLDLYLKLKI